MQIDLNAMGEEEKMALYKVLHEKFATVKNKAQDGEAAPAALFDHENMIESLQRVQVKLYDVEAKTVVEQCPIRADTFPEIFRVISKSVKTVGKKTIIEISGYFQGGKTLTQMVISLVVNHHGCWAFLVINVPGNGCLEALSKKLQDIIFALGLPGRVHIETDRIFTAERKDDLKKFVRLLDYPENICILVAKATEKVFREAIEHIPDEHWERCVVMMDEAHCFCTTKDDSKKQAERQFRHILFGPEGEASYLPFGSLRVRSLVLCTATPADLVHLYSAMKVGADEIFRIKADLELMQSRGYISVFDHELFRGVGLEAVLAESQWYGKDVDRRHVAMIRQDGASFIRDVTKADFHPVVADFFDDALSSSRSPRALPNFLLELTTLKVQDAIPNSVHDHARVTARLYPDCIAFAECGKGVFRYDAKGRLVKRYVDKTFQSAYDDVFSKPENAMKSIYVISNLGGVSMSYSQKSHPVTHLHVHIPANNSCNVLAKAQAMGRACGYFAEQMKQRGKKVQVLCTKADFDSVRAELERFTNDVSTHYPNHASAENILLHSDNLAKRFLIGHADNPRAKQMRKMANEAVPSASKVDSKKRDPAQVERLHKSVVKRFAVRGLQDFDVRLVSDEGGIVVSEVVVDIPTDLKDVPVDSRVLILSGGSRVEDLVEAVNRYQADILPEGRVGSYQITAWKANGKKKAGDSNRTGNLNPSRIGVEGGHTRNRYNWVWAYDERENVLVAVVRTIAFHDIVVPFVHLGICVHFSPGLSVDGIDVFAEVAQDRLEL